MKAPVHIPLWIVLLFAVVFSIYQGQQSFRNARDLETLGPWSLASIREQVELYPSVSKSLAHQPNSLWMPSSIPESWAEQATERDQGKFISVDEVRAASREAPFEVIKIAQLPRTREGYLQFMLSRCRYSWRNEKWTVDELSDKHLFVVLEVNGAWRSAHILPVAQD